jgi:hypothetical protein
VALYFLKESCLADKYTISLPTFDECLSSNGRYEVSEGSPIEVRQALETFARYFKNEFHYNNIQYEADEHNNKCIGFLFTESAMDIVTEEHTQMPTRCSGGCCFRNVEFRDGEEWVLYWVWLHPFFRKRGTVSRHWKHFKCQFSDFHLEPPLSNAMQSFIKKQNITTA